MNTQKAPSTWERREAIRREAIRRVRKKYDENSPNGRALRAELRRCATPDEILIHGPFYYLLSALEGETISPKKLASVVVCFSAAEQEQRESTPFSFGKFLRKTLFRDVEQKDLVARSIRFRKLLAEDPEEPARVSHEIRALVNHASRISGKGVDWGVLGAEMTWFGDAIKRQWARDFFGEESKSSREESGQSVYLLPE